VVFAVGWPPQLASEGTVAVGATADEPRRAAPLPRQKLEIALTY